MPKLFFLVQSEIMTGGVIEAQVIASLRAQCAADGQPPTRLIFLEAATEVRKPAVRATLKKFRNFWPEGRISLVPFVGRWGGDAAPGRALALALWQARLSREELIFHCRGPRSTMAAAYIRQLFGRGRVIFDVRGASPYETIHRLGYAWPENLSEKAKYTWDYNLQLDRKAAHAADKLFTVSPGVRDYAIQELGAAPEKISIVPSCVGELSYRDEYRQTARARWGVTNDAPVLLYSGRLGPERLPQHLFRLFRALLDQRPDAKLVILCYLNELNNLTDLRTAAGVPENSIIVNELPRDEVVKTLSGADLAAVFLESAKRYQHCFPIKVPEYLGAGVPLVVNDTFETIPRLLRDHKIGWIINEDISDVALSTAAHDICERLSADRAGFRERALAVCAENFLWPLYLPTLRHAYGIAPAPTRLPPIAQPDQHL